jgi:hypothetical protein
MAKRPAAKRDFMEVARGIVEQAIGLGRLIPLLFVTTHASASSIPDHIVARLPKWKPFVQLGNGLLLSFVGGCLLFSGLDILSRWGSGVLW